MNKKKIAICTVLGIVVLVLGFSIGFFIGKDTDKDVSAEITTTTKETTEAVSETEEDTIEELTEQEELTEEPIDEIIVEDEYTQVDETVYAIANVNIRAGASTSDKIIGMLNKGGNIKRIAVGINGWSQVLYNEETAYIYSEYLTREEPGNSSVVGLGDISKTDAENLTELLEYIIGYGMGEYNYKDQNAFEMAFATIHALPYYSFSERYAEVYNIDYSTVAYYDDCASDPKGYFMPYRRVKGEYIDFILENMFNVKPDHSFVMYSEVWPTDGPFAYYDGGYYYSDAGDGGDGCGPEMTIKKVEVLSDGKYLITVNYREVEAGGEVLRDFGNYGVVAEIKNIDGKHIWSFYEINEVR